MSDAYPQLLERVKDYGRLSAVEQLLDWDQEVNMPEGGARARAEQMSLIAGLAHDMKTSDELGRLLHDAAPKAADEIAQTNIREMKRIFDRAVKVPTDLVKRIAHTSSLAKMDWAKARRESNFALFAPKLRELLELKKEQAERIGYNAEPYEALMDEFEPGAKAAEIEALFSKVREFTVPFLKQLMDSPHQPDPSILSRQFPVSAQTQVSRRVAELLNFDFTRGRADLSVHPFCTTIGPSDDVRITTRYLEQFLPSGLYGTMHEVGHALYEQGLQAEYAYTPMGESISLGIHESQSRLWENLVGRSRTFCEFFYPELQRAFPDALGNVSIDDFYGAINTVAPSCIRVEADELTYNLHIILRFQIERGLFNGSVAVDDIPDVWNQSMEETVGIRPSNDAEGCLQDIHWSMGGFGYFPTYALGNLYAAQFFAKAKQDIPDLEGKFRSGVLRPLLDWLRENIHRHGKRYRASELVERVTGSPLKIDAFTTYMQAKFGPIYQVG